MCRIDWLWCFNIPSIYSVITFKTAWFENQTRWPEPLVWHELNHNDFMSWLLHRQEMNNLSDSQMKTKRSALNCLFMDYGQQEVYKSINSELTPLLKGLRRDIIDDRTRNGGKLREGKKGLQIETYSIISKCFILDSVATNHHCDGQFSHLFLVLMWNLMCRASNCCDILLEHLEWSQDALVVF